MTPRLAGAAILVAALAAPIHAAETGVELRAGYLDFTNASQSAAAVFDGGRGGVVLGVALQRTLGERYGVRLGASSFKRTGERAFVADPSSPVFRLGHPLEVRLLPVYLDVYRRFFDARLQPYAGLGVGTVLYRETSTVAEEVTRTTRTRPSARALLGATFGQGPLRLGLELSYARVPGALGQDGVSKVYGESDAGGVAVVALLRWQL